MPYKSFKRSSYRPKRRFNRRYRRGGSSLARKVAWLAKQSKPETHFFDRSVYAAADPAVAGNFSSALQQIAQGDDDHERTGNQITVKSLYIRAKYVAAADCLVRTIILQDRRQRSDTAPVIADVLDSGLGDYILAPLAEVNVGRFKILYDRTISLDTTQHTNVPINLYRKLHVVNRFNGAAAGDIETNGIYVVTMASAGAACAVTMHARIGYYDQ